MSEQINETATRLADAARELAHQTLSSDPLYPSAFTPAVSALAQGAASLAQTVEQLARITARLGEHDGLYDDSGESASDRAAVAATLLHQSTPLVRQLSQRLDAAFNELSHLGVKEPQGR